MRTQEEGLTCGANMNSAGCYEINARWSDPVSPRELEGSDVSDGQRSLNEDVGVCVCLLNT